MGDKLAYYYQERTSVFREMQVVSHVINRLTRGEIPGIWEFIIPDGFCLRPVQDGETRVVCADPDGASNKASIVNSQRHTSVRVFPLSFDPTQRFKVLTLGLDQGSVGTAWVAFAMFSMRATIYPKFDKFHRIVRGIKLTLTHACDGIFL